MRTVTYTPPPTVERFMLSPAFIRAIIGPFGSGKSVGCVMALMQWAMEQEPAADGIRYTRFVIIRNTNRMLEDTTIQTVHEWVPPGAAGHWAATKRNFTIKFGDVHSEWWFRALDHPDDARNLLSMEMTGAWINEFREVHPQIFTDLVGRLGRYRGPGGVRPTRVGMILDSNPPPIDGFWYDLFESPLSPDMQAIADKVMRESGRPLRELFKQPSGRSPEAENIENLPENYYDLMVANNADKGEEWVAVHVDGKYGFLHDGQPVYHGFSRELHVAKEPLQPVPGKPLGLGIDFGLTPALVVGQQDASGRWLILGELYRENMGLERFLELAVPWLKQRWPDHSDYELWADPAGTHRSQTDESTCFDILRAHGFRPRKGPQDMATRRGSVQRVLSRLIDGRPGIIYDPSCTMLITGKLGGYHMRMKKTAHEEMVETPVKNKYSHPADAEQYLISSYEGTALKGREARKFGRRGANRPIVVQSRWSPYG